MEAVLTGRRLSPAWCAEHGLINRVTSAGEALDAALELASLIAGNGPLAVQASKQVIIESADWPNTEAFDRQEAIVDPIRRSADAREGAAAFTEKRVPQWSGC